MKTSNKILSTAFAAYLLFTAGNSAAILKEYKRAEASGKALITQLEKTSIHVLSVEGDNYIQASRGRKSSQTLGFWSPFDPETTPLRICGDTLYISGTSYGYVTLPDLKVSCATASHNRSTKIRHQKTGRVYNTTGFLIP